MTWEEYEAGLAPELEGEDNPLPPAVENTPMVSMAELLADVDKNYCPF